MGELTANAIKKLKVAELKAELSKRGLAVKGKKDELAKRLLEAIESEEEEQQEDKVEDDVLATSPQENSNQDVDTSGKKDDSDVVMADAAPQTTQEPVQVEEEEGNNAASDAATVVVNDEEDKEKSENKDHDSATTSIADGWVMIDDADANEAAKGAEQLNLVQTESGETNSEPRMDVLAGEEAEKEDQQRDSEAKMEVDTDQNASSGATESSEKKSEPENSEAKMEDAAGQDASSSGVDQNDVKSEKEQVVSNQNTDTPQSDEKKKNEDGDKKQKEKSAMQPEDVYVDVEHEDGEDEELPDISEGHVALDGYSNDLNFVISKSGLSGRNLVKNGFKYMWAGARANKGAKAGKIGYELKIVKELEVDLPADKESPIHAVRVGWSIENASLQLGEALLSYGYESTGKVCASSKFIKYGETFGVGDVIGTYLDLDSEKKTLRYTKNGVELGVAVSLNLNLDEKPLFPHLFIRNMEVELNFGGNENAWFDVPEGYSLLQNAGAENIAESAHEPPTTAEECEVLLMIGLPNSGKSTWVRKYVESHIDKQFNIIGINQVLERCKLEGKRRQKNDAGHDNLMAAVIKVLTKFYQLCPTKREISSMTSNVYKISQTKKMAPFVGTKKKAVVVVPTHDNLRRRTSDARRKGDNIHDVPFADLCDMKCEFHLPQVGECFDEIIFPELDERNATKTIRDYQSDGCRAKRTGRDEYYPKRRPRNDERSYSRRDGYGGRDRHDDGWRNSGSGYGGAAYGGSYGSGGYGGYKHRNSYGSSYGSGYHNSRSSGGHYDPNRRSGGGYRQNYGGGGGSGYRSGNYGSSGYGGGYGSGGGGYGSYGSNNYGGGYNYNNYNSGSYARGGGSNTGGQWGQYNASYNQSGQTQQWGSSNSGGWSGYNYSNYGGGNSGYSY